MSAQELQSLIQMLRSGGPDLAAPLPQARQNFETMLAGIPIPEDVSFESVTIAGIPARWSMTPGAPKDRVLLYFHGGGYSLGSSLGYRPLYSALARAAGARGLAIDYRLAPENPFPAAVDDALAAYRGIARTGIQAWFHRRCGRFSRWRADRCHAGRSARRWPADAGRRDRYLSLLRPGLYGRVDD